MISGQTSGSFPTETTTSGSHSPFKGFAHLRSGEVFSVHSWTFAARQAAIFSVALLPEA